VKRLLIADDEEGVRSLVRMTLESDTYEILEAADGEEALLVARESEPSLVFLDAKMPGLDGYDVCRLLKDDPATSEMTVVMLTARSQESDIRAGFDAGADDYITKPFSPMALLRKVEKVFEGQRAS
jgi:DNA-binding response OmpR family regulator